MRYQKFDTCILSLGFKRSKAYHCLYLRLADDHFIDLVLYVDDMLLIGNDKESIKEVNLLNCPLNLR